MKICHGSIVGKDHWATQTPHGLMPIGKNNQDACAYTETEDHALAVVADGCGSGEHSEFGAKLAVQRLVECVNLGYSSIEHFDRELKSVLRQAYGLFEPGPKTVNDYFLFTILGILYDKRDYKATIFGCGDGVYATAKGSQLLKYENNTPPYLGYNLLTPGKCSLTVYEHGWDAEMFPAIVGTDGLAEYPDWATEYPKWVEKNAHLTRLFRLKHEFLHDDTTAVGLGL